MKYILIVMLLFTLKASAQTCDSAIVIYITNHNEFSPVTFAGLQIDSFENGLISKRYFSSGQHTIMYEHDSLGRLISETSSDSISYSYDSLSRIIAVKYFQWNGSSWEYKPDTSQVDYFYSVNHLDSTVKSVWNGFVMVPFYRALRFYNANDTLTQINVELYDTVSSWFVDTLTIVSYTPNRIDSLYANGVITTYPDEIRSYDSMERIINITAIFMGQSDMLQYFSYDCNQLRSYERTYFGSHNSHNEFVTFDSLCRIQKIVSGYYSLVDEDNVEVKEYYYTSCNTMVVHADEDLRICQGDTAELSAMFFGGTPPFEINWSPDSVFPNDTSLMVYATPDSSTNYYVTVTDSNGLSVTDTIFVHVSTRPLADIYISAIDTFSTCQSATLKIDSLHDVFYSWNETSNPATLSNTSELNIIYNGTYRLVAQENSSYWLTVCPMAIDSIVFNYFSNPAPEINLELECNYFVVHSNENLTYQWYLSNVLISDSIRDTLFVDSTGYYNVIGVDTSGCMSAVSIAMLFQTVFVPLSLSVSIGHPSCDTCSDGYVNLQGNGGTNWYHYSMNGLPSGRYIDSLSAGLYQFCVYDDNNCMVCDNAVYVPVNEISFKAGTYFPNPFSDKLHFNYPHIKSASSEFILFDATGREVKRFPITSNEFYLTRESLTPGIFFFIIVENGNVMDRGRVILN